MKSGSVWNSFRQYKFIPRINETVHHLMSPRSVCVAFFLDHEVNFRMRFFFSVSKILESGCRVRMGIFNQKSTDQLTRVHDRTEFLYIYFLKIS